MATNVQLLKDALRKEGLLYTPQRQIIWDEICKTDDHRDAEEIYFKIKQGGHKVSRATVYRTIDVLVKNNLVRKLELGDGRNRYENKLDSSHHDHIVCIQCGRIDEFMDENIEKLQDEIAKKYQFKIVRHIHQL
ncbi:MAG TPA: transcriptional repressor, partial [Candidatus Marinimicrobia bacterium]|nr:transcriptional repressor [Candidatus Neomarinimicrobiota bacterium]